MNWCEFIRPNSPKQGIVRQEWGVKNLMLLRCGLYT